jgi:integrating conjugative element protein (TIGR03756 family)
MKSKLILGISLSVMLSASAAAQSILPKRNISTDDIAESSFPCTDCIDWKIIGVCFWLKCSLFSCSVKESIKYSHFIPDLIVSSYSGTDSPWTETASMNDAPDGSMSLNESPRDQETFLNFKNVDIITNPGIFAWNILGDTDYFCNSQIQLPMMPHFLSGLDPNWNDPGIEQLYPQSILGWPTIKAKDVVFLPSALDPYWAPVYPRCGWGAHPLDPINGAVAAFRASHILTNRASLHVHIPITASCGNRCWKPGAVKENSSTDNKFQMIFPEMEDSGRAIGGSASWANGKNITEQAYVWNLWRRYRCCDKKGQIFLFSVDWN